MTNFARKNFTYLLCFVIITAVISTSTVAESALDLSVVPVDGGTTLRFSRGELNNGVTKEVRVRITADENVQYQVFQQLISPFVNEQGVTINRPVFVASILSGSNGSGTAYLSSFEPVNRGEQLLYTSAPSGMSESFTLVYKVDTQYLSDSGSFTGLLQYVLRPVSGGERQTVETNVFIESNAELTVEAQGSTSQNLARLDTRQDAVPAYVNLSFSGNAGGQLRVYQEIAVYPINDLNSELESGILKMFSEGGQQGELSYPGVVEVPRNRALVYRSSQQSDSFSVNYSLAPDSLAKQMAGSYRGVLRFSFETARGVNKHFDIDLDIRISPVFELKMDFPQGPIDFKSVLPGTDPQIKEVDVEVKSNLGRPYVVTQKVGDLLVNEKGQSIPKQYFVLKQEVAKESSGRPANTDFAPVEQGDSVIFYSDKNGSPAKFKVYYRLSPFAGMTAGDYRTSMVYSLGEL